MDIDNRIQIKGMRLDGRQKLVDARKCESDKHIDTQRSEDGF